MAVTVSRGSGHVLRLSSAGQRFLRGKIREARDHRGRRARKADAMGTSATYSVSVAGFTGAAVLVLVTAVPGPAPVRLALAVTGMGVVVLTWLALGRRVRELSVRDLYWTAAAWCLPLLFARPLFSGDVHSYHAQGLLAAAGLDPYQVGPSALGGSPVVAQVSPYWQDTPAPYGPVWLAISRTIARTA